MDWSGRIRNSARGVREDNHLLFLARYWTFRTSPAVSSASSPAWASPVFGVAHSVSADFGSALVFFPILIVMLYVGGIDRRYILFILLSIGFTSFSHAPIGRKVLFPRGNILDLFFQRPGYVVMLSGLFLIALALSLWAGWFLKSSIILA
jgi:cell division protein FtsW (lipid II flippase)